MSSAQNILQSGHLNNETRTKVLTACFGNGLPSWRTSSFGRFTEHYVQEPKQLTYGCKPGSYPIASLGRITHEDIFGMIRVLSQSKYQIRQQISEETGHGGSWRSQNGGDAGRILDLTVRMWLMLNVRDVGLNAIIHPLWGPDTLQWDDQESLDDLVTTAFPRSETRLNLKESRLEPGFTAQYLVGICGLEIRWTKSLHNHLRLDRRYKHLWIFPYTDFLVGHLEAGGQKASLSRRAGGGRASRVLNQANNEGSVPNSQQHESKLPRELLQETICTLVLLFPDWDKDTQKLLERYNREAPEFAPLFDEIFSSRYPHRPSLRDFSFWRERLLELHKTVYMAPPDSWRQLLFDRRNPLQYYTFWIAAIVFIFSLGSFILSIIQTWATLQALRQGN